MPDFSNQDATSGMNFNQDVGRYNSNIDYSQYETRDTGGFIPRSGLMKVRAGEYVDPDGPNVYSRGRGSGVTIQIGNLIAGDKDQFLDWFTREMRKRGVDVRRA